MNKNKHKIITFAALMTVATIVIHFINRTIAAAAQLKQLLGITHSNILNGVLEIFIIQKKVMVNQFC